MKISALRAPMKYTTVVTALNTHSHSNWPRCRHGVSSRCSRPARSISCSSRSSTSATWPALCRMVWSMSPADSCSPSNSQRSFRRIPRRLDPPVRLRRARHRLRIAPANDRARHWPSASGCDQTRARPAADPGDAPQGPPRWKALLPPQRRRRSPQPPLLVRRPLSLAAPQTHCPSADHAPRPHGVGDRPNRFRADANCCGSPGSIGPAPP